MLNRITAAMRPLARSACVAAFAATALAGTSLSVNAEQLIFNNYAPPPSPITKVLFNYFADQIKEKTHGEVTVTIPSTSLAPVDGAWDLVTSGGADVVNQPRYARPQQLKLAQIAELPFNTLSAEAASVALTRTYQKYFEKFGEYKDVKLLAFSVFAGRQIMNKVRPVSTVDDYHGLKLWTTPGLLAKAVEAVGATPVVAPFPQLFEFASKGTVDGMMFTPETAMSSQTAKYVKYYTVVPGGLGSLSFALVMNKQRWEALSPEHQKIIQDIADTLPSVFGKAQDAAEAGALKAMDVKVTDASPELIAALQERLKGFEAAWIVTAKEAGVENPEEVLSYYKEQMKQVAAEAAK